jgi:hypothetical protein
VPARLTVCGEPLALSAILIEAANAPATVGAKVTVITQVPFTASAVVVEQVLVSENELAFAPVIDIPLIVSAAVPEFVSVTDCVAVSVVPTAVDAKLSVLADKEAAGTGTNPDPLRLTVSGEPSASPAILSVAARAPAMVGAKVTVTVQDAPVASPVPHVLVCEKELALAPPIVMPLIVRGSVPELVRVTDCVVGSVVPTGVNPKTRRVGDGVTSGDAATLNLFTRLATLIEPSPEAVS